MVVQINEELLVYCSYCGNMMTRTSLPSETPQFKCLDCDSRMFYGKIVVTDTGEEVDSFTINLNFKTHTSTPTAKKEEI